MSQQPLKAVLVYSGGLDSTTLLYHLLDLGYTVSALSANYGQRHHDQEWAAAQAITNSLGVPLREVDLRSLITFLGHNSLTNLQVAVPQGEYSADTMALTVVPNRNMILLSVALAWAIDLGYEAVAFGAHGGEYTPYPDCQPAFSNAMNALAQTCHTTPLQVLAPFVNWDKTAIVRRAKELGVPLEKTWSCYNGRTHHCGTCGTCLDRKKAFQLANIPDPTKYEG